MPRSLQPWCVLHHPQVEEPLCRFSIRVALRQGSLPKSAACSQGCGAQKSPCQQLPLPLAMSDPPSVSGLAYSGRSLARESYKPWSFVPASSTWHSVCKVLLHCGVICASLLLTAEKLWSSGGGLWTGSSLAAVSSTYKCRCDRLCQFSVASSTKVTHEATLSPNNHTPGGGFTSHSDSSSFLSCGLGQRGKSGRLSWLRVRWVFLDGFVRLTTACVHVRQRQAKLGCDAFMYGRQKGLRETAA